MANPSAAHEPSMEEILASIRQIISEESEASLPDTQGEVEEAETRSEPAHPTDQTAEFAQISQIESGDAERLRSSDGRRQQAQRLTPSSEAARQAETVGYYPAIAAHNPAASLAQPGVPPQRPIHNDDGQALLSSASDSAVSGAFSALAHTIMAQNARTLEELVSEMLRPMLKAWLDDNLPGLVERLVREEIERVSRGRR